MINKIKNEINGFSNWFKWTLYVLFFIYLGTWLFTIYLSNIQEANNLKPILPVVPQDSEEYRNLAESLLVNKEFSQHGQSDTLRAPGYPSFVAFFKYIGQSYFAVSLVQILLALFSAIIIRRLGIYFHSKQTGEIAAVMFLLSPLVLTLSLIILTDILFLSIFLTGFYLALVSRKFFISSVLFALAIYVRPMGIFALPIFLVPFLISDDFTKANIWNKLKFAVLMIVVVGALASPWVYRNYKLTGVADFTSFKAINLAAYAVPLYLANKNNTSVDEERTKIEQNVGIPQSKWKDLRYSKEVATYAQDIILREPFSYLKYHIIASLPFLFSSSIQDAQVTYQGAMHIERKSESGAINRLVSGNWKLFFASISKIWWKMAERMIWLLVYLVAIVGLWQKKKSVLAWGFVFIPAYLMILSGPAANARYAVQGLPFILLLFAIGAIYLKDKLMKINAQQ